MVQGRFAVIRVGFAIDGIGRGWLGGVNYFRNLLAAVDALPGKPIEPVLFAGLQAEPDILNNFLDYEIVYSAIFDIQDIRRIVRKIWHKTFGRDFFLERLLVRNRIDVLSHSGSLGSGAAVPTIGWIPDFQHLHLPDLFDAQEIRKRNNHFRELCRCCTYVLLSSYEARKDLETFSPECAAKAKVFRFSSCLAEKVVVPCLSAVEMRYKFSAPYFHLPNQFWLHKNHRVVIDALRILRRAGHKVLVLATGNTSDYRRSEYFKDLMNYAKDCEVSDAFRVLGLVPYADLVALMEYSTAIINPSLIEGWSTTVEEAKSLGKRVVLSDIPVHREQNPDRGVFFPADNPERLAKILHQVWRDHNPEDEKRKVRISRGRLPERRCAFGESYQMIVTDVVGGRRSRGNHKSDRPLGPHPAPEC